VVARRSYLVCSVQRAGSWLLCHAPEDTGALGRPAEPPQFDRDAIGRLLRYAQACEACWQDWFATHSIKPIEVVYGNLIEDVDQATRERGRVPSDSPAARAGTDPPAHAMPV
jgi:LPS sulfotransferase NodH